MHVLRVLRVFTSLVLFCGIVVASVPVAATSEPPITSAPVAADNAPVRKKKTPARSAASLAAEERARKAGLFSPERYVFKDAARGLQQGRERTDKPETFAAQAEPTLPSGYSMRTVASGFDAPVKAVWAPDGRIFVAEHGGVIKVVSGGAVRTLVDFSDHVNAYLDRGLNSIALDPDFATNGYLYAAYTYENDPANPNGCKTATVTRFTVTSNTAGNETTILGKVRGGGKCSYDAQGNPVGSACPASTTQDCIPSDHWSHSAGDIQFAADKTLFVTFGDGASYAIVDAERAYRAQNIDSLAGKVLRVDRNGNGLAINPHYNGNATHNRSKVWARGDRNQFRFTVASGIPFGGNVGWTTVEEIQRSIKGGNNGWPCYEGAIRSPGYDTTAQCKAMYAAGTAVQRPSHTWQHNGNSASAVGGVFVHGTSYPADLKGAYIYGDYSQSTISYVRFDAALGAVTAAPKVLVRNAEGPVAFAASPDGALHYVSIMTGELRRIDYAAAVTCGSNMWRTDYFKNASLSGTPAQRTCETPLSPKIDKDWWSYAPRFDPPDPTFPADNFSVRATCLCSFASGNYQFKIAADDQARLLIDGQQLIAAAASGTATKSLSGTHTVTVEYIERTGNAKLLVDWVAVGSPPKPVITAPFNGDYYQTGSRVNFSGTATTGSGAPLPASALAWNIQLRHCYNPSDCHSHTVTTATGTSGSFTMPQPDPPPDVDYIIVSLTATDPATGQKATATTNVYYGTNTCAANSWKVQFFANTTLSSAPDHENCWDFLPDAKLNQDWSTYAPMFNPADPDFPADFSTRFHCNCDFNGATTFTARADGHAILYIDGVARLDTRTTSLYSTTLTGRHRITVEFVDTSGPANLLVRW